MPGPEPSRLTENRHFASDILFSAAVGIVSAHAVVIRHHQSVIALAPLAVPGGYGVVASVEHR